MTQFYTTEKISENREKTPEGFLLCKATPIARIGTQVYTAEEVPGIEPDENGLVLVERPEEEVFHPEAIASAEGKSFTLGHPSEDVNPDNWRELTHGHAQNVRRGEGDKADLLVCDLLVMSRQGIEAVESGTVELSNGYEVIYEPAGKGKAVQRNPRINHVALVPSGRCGPRCAIGDSNPMRQETMPKTPTKAKGGTLDAIFRAMFRAAKDEELERENAPAQEDQEGQEPTPAPEESAPEKPAKDNPVEAKLDQLIAAVTGLAQAMKSGSAPSDEEQEKPEEETDNAPVPEEETARAGDAGARAMDGQELRARADILVPGHSFDCKKACDTMRKALAAAYPKHRDTINTFTRGVSDFAALDCVTLEAAFVGASEVLKARNNQGTADAATMRTGAGGSRAMDNAALNKQNADFWKRQNKE